MTKFYALDFDRTLGDTGRIANQFIEFVTEYNPDIGDGLRSEKERVEAEGGSYDMLALLHSQLSAAEVENYVDTFVTEVESYAFLLDGAEELLTTFSHQGNVGIVTYGGEQWQEAKLRMTGLETYPHLVVPRRGEKGRLIASWYDASHQTFTIPQELGGGEVNEIVLVDDKLAEFDGLPESPHAHGYLVSNASIHEVAANIAIVASLREVLQRESDRA